MPSFRVKFVNTLLSSDGHPFTVLQRLIHVRRSRTAESAIRVAQRRFEQLEHVPDWRLHAQSVEVEQDDVAACSKHAATSAQAVPGKVI